MIIFPQVILRYVFSTLCETSVKFVHVELNPERRYSSAMGIANGMMYIVYSISLAQYYATVSRDDTNFKEITFSRAVDRARRNFNFNN